MTSKKTLVRDFLFAVLIMALGSLCTGCCWAITEGTWDRLGSEKAVITNRHYEYSPNRSEIVFFRQEKNEALCLAVPCHLGHILEYVHTFRKAHPAEARPGGSDPASAGGGVRSCRAPRS